MRLVVTGLLLGFASLGLLGCIGETPVSAELHNPKTHEEVSCGVPMAGALWVGKELKARDKCISTFVAKGFVLDDAIPAVTDPALLHPNPTGGS